MTGREADGRDVDGRDVDLDVPAPVPRPPRPRRVPRGRVATAALALAGALAGGVLADAGHRGTAAGGDQLLATLDLRGVVLSTRPLAVLVLDLVGVGDAPVVAETVTVSGAGLVTTTRPLGRTVRPDAPGPVAAGGGTTETVTVEVPLSCSRADGAGLPARAVVTVRAPSGTPGPHATTAVVVPVGRLARPGGLCSAADDVLPMGWLEQARVTAASFGGDGSLALTIAGLPGNVSDVFAAEADGVIVPVPDAPVPVRGGTATVRFGPPGSSCQDSGTHAIVPTGLQLLVHSDDVSRFVYLPVGPAMADWMMAAFVRSCPDSPAGPSAVRPLLGG